MKKRIIIEKNEFLKKISEGLSYYLNEELNVDYGVIEDTIESEEIVTDIIEIKCEVFNNEVKEALTNITEYYDYKNNTIIIELVDLRNYINNLYKVEVTEVYDFFECNIFGDMLECIAFELI